MWGCVAYVCTAAGASRQQQLCNSRQRFIPSAALHCSGSGSSVPCAASALRGKCSAVASQYSACWLANTAGGTMPTMGTSAHRQVSTADILLSWSRCDAGLTAAVAPATAALAAAAAAPLPSYIALPLPLPLLLLPLRTLLCHCLCPCCCPRRCFHHRRRCKCLPCLPQWSRATL